MLLALCYTSIVTPYEVMVMQGRGVSVGLIAMNYLIDAAFIGDIAVNFSLAYWDEELEVIFLFVRSCAIRVRSRR